MYFAASDNLKHKELQGIVKIEKVPEYFKKAKNAVRTDRWNPF
jgi:hypothetical protein